MVGIAQNIGKDLSFAIERFWFRVSSFGFRVAVYKIERLNESFRH